MENRTLFIAYLVIWLPYIMGLHAYASWRRLGHGIVTLSHAVPSLVAITMAYIFLLSQSRSRRYGPALAILPLPTVRMRRQRLLYPHTRPPHRCEESAADHFVCSLLAPLT